MEPDSELVKSAALTCVQLDAAIPWHQNKDWCKRPNKSLATKFGATVGGVKHRLLKATAQKRKSPNIITLQSKESLTGHAPPFTGIILSPRFPIRWDKPNLALWDAKRSVCTREEEPDIVVVAARSDSGSRWGRRRGSITTEPWGHSAPSMLYLCIHIGGEWEWSLTSILSRLNIFRKPLIRSAVTFWEALTVKCDSVWVFLH